MEIINVELNIETIANLAIAAHEKDITLNEHVNNILRDKIKEELKMITKVNDDGSITIPDEYIKLLNWDENVMLTAMLDGNSIIIKEKTDWTSENAQEHIEYIVERVNITNKPHHILHNGKMIVVAPYSDELRNILESNID